MEENKDFKINNENKQKYSKVYSNNNKKKKYIPLWYRFWISIADIDKYYYIATEGLRRSILYIVILVILASLIVTGAFVNESKKVFKGSADFIANNISDFTISKDGLKLENDKKPIETKLNRAREFKIIINDESSEDENNSAIEKNNGEIIIFGKNAIYLKVNDIEKTFTYDEVMNFLELEKISKSDIIGLASNEQETNRMFIAMLFSLSIYFILQNIVIVVAYIIAIALVGVIMATLLGMKFKFSAIISMSISAITLPVVLAIIYAICFIYTGFIMKYFTVMFSAISYVYIIMALIDIFHNLVKISGEQ